MNTKLIDLPFSFFVKNKILAIFGFFSLMYFGQSTFSLVMAQQVVSSNTSSSVVATGGDITVNSGVSISTTGVDSISVNGVSVSNLTNNGSVLPYWGGSGINFNSLSSLATITNNGNIGRINSSHNTTTGINLNSAASIINNGSIDGSGGLILIHSGATGSSITNNATIGTQLQDFSAISIDSGTTVSSLLNASGATMKGVYGIVNSGTITELINYGTIYSAHWVPANAIYGGGAITNLVNYGTISGANGGMAIGNTIVNLANAQGAAQGNPLTIINNPTNYSIIINSPTSYGQLSVQSMTGAMGFSIYSGSVVRSGFLYASVLRGVDAPNLSTTSGVFGGSSWALSLESGSSTIWDLCFGSNTCTTSLSTNITSGSGNTLSAVGSSLNPVFDGGALSLINGDNSNQAFTINSTGGTITSPTGGSATLSGVFSGAGGMTFNGSGTTYMNGVSTYTGGTTVASGTLSVGSDESNKSARLAGDITVASGATLAGHGGIGGNVTNNGRVAPGGSIGTLYLAGNYVQGSGATLSTSITPTANSVLAVGGTASLAGGFAIDASSGTYAKKTYIVLTSAGLTGKFSSISGNLASYSSLNSALSYDANNVYLNLSAGAADTQQSLVNTASALQGTYTLQNTVLANSFSYDCTLFGANDVCISAGGRNTAVQAEGINNSSGLLIAAYRPHPNYRIGAYADQNLSTNSPGGTVKLGNNTPLIGLFSAWNEKLDGTGAEVKISAAYGQKNATVTRSVVGNSDPGMGSSNLTSQGAQVQAKYSFAVMPEVIVSPYVGVRYTQNNMGGYTEATSSSVTAPLTYSALNTNATTALAGIGASYRVIPTVTTFASAGVETDTNTANGTYSATGVVGLTPVNFNANPVKTRPTATVGAYYDIEKNQRLGITGIYRQEAYQAVSTTTVMATYTIGL